LDPPTQNKRCGMIAGDHFRREPKPYRAIGDREGAARERSLGPRRAPARSRVPANEKARGQFPGAGFEILSTMIICQ